MNRAFATRCDRAILGSSGGDRTSQTLRGQRYEAQQRQRVATTNPNCQRKKFWFNCENLKLEF